MSAISGLLQWIFVGELIVEITLGVFAFLAENDVYYPGALPWALVEIAMLVLNLAVWLSIAFCCGGGGQRGARGTALLRADTVYFAITTVIHLILALGWIVFLARSFGVAPLTWADNPDAFAVFRALFSRQLSFVALLLIFSLFDARLSDLRCKLLRRVRSASMTTAARDGQ